MKTFATALLLAAAALPAWAGVTKDDIKKLSAAKLGDDVIIAFIRANGGGSKLSADDLVELKGAGVSDGVMKALVGAEAGPAPAPRQTDAEAMKILNGAQIPSYQGSDETATYGTPTYSTTYVSAPYYSSWYYPYYYYRPYYYPSFTVGYWGGCHGYYHSSSIHHHNLGSFRWTTRR